MESDDLSYRSLFEGVPVALYRSAPDGTLLDANPAMVALLAASDLDALKQRPSTEWYAEGCDRERWRQAMAEQGVVIDFEAQLRRFDQSLRWVRDSARAVRDKQGGSGTTREASRTSPIGSTHSRP